jgi:hypothetical protein
LVPRRSAGSSHPFGDGNGEETKSVVEWPTNPVLHESVIVGDPEVETPDRRALFPGRTSA